MAERDILSRFETPGRKPAAGQPEQQTEESGPPEYLAFETEDKLITLDILRATGGPCRCPLLRNYLDIAYVPPNYNSFTLFFTYMTVKVHGENLRDVINAFRFGKCTSIREYSASLYQKPEPGKPLIEKIEIVVRPLHESITESEQADGD